MRTCKELEKVDRDVLSSKGSSVGVFGKAYVSTVLNGTFLQQEMIVADISVDGILGLDFLVKRDAIINLLTRKVSIRDGKSYAVRKHEE